MHRTFKSLLTLLAVAVLSMSAVATELPQDLGNAVLGVYTMPAATPEAATMLEGVEVGTPQTIYFVLYHADLTSYNLGGFEFSWRVEPAGMTPLVTAMDFQREDFYNFGDNFNLRVGYQYRDPHMPDEPFVLFSATVVFLEAPTGAEIYLGPVSNPSIDGEMVIADFVFPEQMQAMKPANATQSHDVPVFVFNPTVPVADASWSGVKAMFN